MQQKVLDQEKNVPLQLFPSWHSSERRAIDILWVEAEDAIQDITHHRESSNPKCE